MILVAPASSCNRWGGNLLTPSEASALPRQSTREEPLQETLPTRAPTVSGPRELDLSSSSPGTDQRGSMVVLEFGRRVECIPASRASGYTAPGPRVSVRPRLTACSLGRRRQLRLTPVPRGTCHISGKGAPPSRLTPPPWGSCLAEARQSRPDPVSA